MSNFQKTIIISAVNLTSGGTFTILDSCLAYLNDFLCTTKRYKVIAFVYDKEVFPYKNIEYIEIKKAKTSWIYRLYIEYFYFQKFSKKEKPFLWFSLHDISPNVKAKRRVVYCHNPSPFYSRRIKDLYFSYQVFLFSYFYKYLYKINIHKNSYVIVQQDWIRNSFIKMYKLDKQKIIVAYPTSSEKQPTIKNIRFNDEKVFFYPALGRPFKNFEIICEAINFLKKKGISNFSVILTIDGTENNYTKWILKKYKSIDNIKFVGLLPHNRVKELYNTIDCLIFPSKLETWGLPISEFLNQNKPMILANLPYAHETASGGELVKFFNPNNSTELAISMLQVIENDLKDFHKQSIQQINEPFTKNWEELFQIILK